MPHAEAEEDPLAAIAAEEPACARDGTVSAAGRDAAAYYAQFSRAARNKRAAAEKAALLAEGAAWQATYPPASEVALDADGYAVSFPCPGAPGDPDAEAVDARAFYDRWGFVVFRDAVSAEDCAASRSEVWQALERDTPGVRRDDPATWELLSSATYGLAPEPAVFTRQLLANRQAPRVVAALAALLRADVAPDAPRRAGMLVSHDRWCFYRPTVAGALLAADHPEWRTRENLHLDLHPWAYRERGAACQSALEQLRFETLRDFAKETNWVNAATGPHLQGVLALAHNAAEDGGTQLVPGFAATFDAYVDALGPVERHSDAVAAAARAAGDDTRPWLIGRAAGGGSWKWAPADPLCSRARRVPLREGSLLLWDQRTAHGARCNTSERPRFAQFIKAYRTHTVSSARVRSRAACVEREARAAGSWDVVSPLGRRVFGLDWGADDSEGEEASDEQ
jgi:hypothetical protein